jgi:hypothetical protein
MGRSFPFVFKFGSKFVLEVLPSVAATVIGGYLLAQLHFNRVSEPPPAQAAIATAEAPTAGEERATMREVLRARRENAEAPAQVRAKVESVPLPAAMEPIDLKDARPAKDGASRATVAAVPPRRDVELPRPRPDAAAAAAYVPAPPPGAASASEPASIPPPAMASASNPVPPALEQRRGPVHAVFSAFSMVVGQAVNVTGETVNWVIDLPGRAISAGERLIGPNPPPARPPSNADG